MHSDELEQIYHRVAALSTVNSSADDDTGDVDHHYVTIMTVGNGLYVLDGDEPGPRPQKLSNPSQGALGEAGLNVIRGYIEQHPDSCAVFKLVQA